MGKMLFLLPLTVILLGAGAIGRAEKPVQQQAVPIPAQAVEAQTPEILLVTLDETGMVFVEQEAILLEQLTPVLERFYRENPSGRVLLLASPDTQFGKVTRLLDLIRSFGGGQVDLVALPPAPPPIRFDLSKPRAFPTLSTPVPARSLPAPPPVQPIPLPSLEPAR